MYQPINAMLPYFLVVLLVKVTYMYNKPSTVAKWKFTHSCKVTSIPTKVKL